VIINISSNVDPSHKFLPEFVMRAEAGESTSQAKTYKAQQERQVLDLGKHEGQSSGRN